jgi:hypothetical protein
MTPRQLAQHKYYLKNKEVLNKVKREYHKERYRDKALEIKVKTAERREKLKKLVMTRYGNKTAACVKCGFDNIDALCLDHINDNGSQERKTVMGKNKNGSGTRFYGYIKKMGFPDGYQTLCANCNLIKEIERKRNERGY